MQKFWCQRRDSNSQTPVSKTGCYSNSHTLALWCTGEDLNLRVPLGEDRVTAGPFRPGSRTCLRSCAAKSAAQDFARGLPDSPSLRSGFSFTPAKRLNLAEGRRIERPWLITMPRFSGPVAGHSAVPSAWRRVRELNPLASCERPCLADKCLTVRPTLRLSCQRTMEFW